MNLPSTLETAWARISDSHSEGNLNSKSSMAFQICTAIRVQHPELNVSYDDRDLPAETGRPNIVVWENGDKPEVLFFGKIMFKPQSPILPGKDIKSFLDIITKKHMDVLSSDKSSGSYQNICLPLSSEFQFGLFVFHEDGQVGFNFQSLTDYFTVDQLSRLNFAYNGASEQGDQHREFFFKQPPKIRRVTRGQSYPDLKFKLDDGRTVCVDALVWEPTYDETLEIPTKGDHKRLVIERKRLKAEELFGKRNVKFIKPEILDGNPPRIKNTSLTVWMSSAPLSPKALYSELIVIFFLEYKKGMSLEEMLKRVLHDLEWERYASDTDEETVALWKEAWLTRTIH